MWQTISTGKTWKGRITNQRKDGKLFTEDVTISPVCDASGQIVNYVAVNRDITERLQLEAQLFQAQKMESVGRLAGGIAHDYNNMLGVILGYGELALEKVKPGEPLHEDLEKMLAAANRSKDITRQLLAFARKETIAPEVLDLNATVESMLKMIRRLIGEDIDLAWLPGSGLWSVSMDPSQVDQIIANLCVNARDAITNVGRITIETDNVAFDMDYCTDHVGFVPGDFVMLAISDNGSGIAPQDLDKVFEPFFTTKGQGKGTGLGLATVYGIVKQNDGFINVYSEPGNGTTIRIYLPRHTGRMDEVDRKSGSEIPSGCGETVLFVEDDGAILELGRRILVSLGYLVLAATTPGEAIALAKAHSDGIHLLITDVVMPEMNGRQLSKQLQSLHRDLKILFISGYTADVIAHRGVLETGVHFLSKPFSKKDLAVKVRQVLDRAKDNRQL
jgi:signal transduction histidine kinase/CheY-like chemotaxis protein